MTEITVIQAKTTKLEEEKNCMMLEIEQLQNNVTELEVNKCSDRSIKVQFPALLFRKL